MLRALALALLLANALYFAWGQGLLAAYGLAPARQSEPERLAQQIRPEALQLVLPAAPPSPPALSAAVRTPPALPAGVSCLQVGVFTERQARTLRPRLKAGLPEGSWSFESSGDSVRWIIYMGKYISKAAMNRKRQMLQQLELPFEPPLSPMLKPGLSLGSFASRTDAEEALAQMNQRGLRSAKVVLERPELPSLWLRLPAVDSRMRTRLDALTPQFAGKAVQACS
ncbi:SPOR domain-containing protein [Polaromonas sp.]|uniref:SPOR domain-containing protein n=1 Tax=Polaromonas sp. TaxID=1869339 RepID=UPI0013B892A6|nr:SPOR domain-containing protein [Polaromonas sp.]NDP62435.1 SPOR domain-containing protein [Polaromonas sp.]